MADLQQLEEQIVGLSLLEAAELVKKFESRLGQPRFEGSQGPGRWRPEDREGRRHEGRSREHQEEVRGCRRDRRGQVAFRGAYALCSIPSLEPDVSPAPRRGFRPSTGRNLGFVVG